jgi:hypothetical protein
MDVLMMLTKFGKKGIFYVIDVTFAIVIFLIGMVFILSFTFSNPQTLQLEISSSIYMDRLFTNSISNYSANQQLLQLRLSGNVSSHYLQTPLIDYIYYLHNISLDTTATEQDRLIANNTLSTLFNATTAGLIPEGYNVEFYFDDNLVTTPIIGRPLEKTDALAVVSYEQIYIGSFNKTAISPKLVRVIVW